jgi:hypothetical protein
LHAQAAVQGANLAMQYRLARQQQQAEQQQQAAPAVLLLLGVGTQR